MEKQVENNSMIFHLFFFKATWPSGTCDATCEDSTSCGGVIQDTMDIFEVSEVIDATAQYMTISKADAKIITGSVRKLFFRF